MYYNKCRLLEKTLNHTGVKEKINRYSHIKLDLGKTGLRALMCQSLLEKYGAINLCDALF